MHTKFGSMRSSGWAVKEATGHKRHRPSHRVILMRRLLKHQLMTALLRHPTSPLPDKALTFASMALLWACQLGFSPRLWIRLFQVYFSSSAYYLSSFVENLAKPAIRVRSSAPFQLADVAATILFWREDTTPLSRVFPTSVDSDKCRR